MPQMSVTYAEAVNYMNEIVGLCQNILLSNGPFLKEGVYQDLLSHELSLLGIYNSREYVFPYRMLDSNGENVTIGNGQSLRSDIELHKLGCILELKSTSHSIKDEYIWQLRNYLEQRPECHWGIVLNFISKFGGSAGGPTIQGHLLYKEGSFVTITGSKNKQIKIAKYKSFKQESTAYPLQEDIILGSVLEVTIPPKDEKVQTGSHNRDQIETDL